MNYITRVLLTLPTIANAQDKDTWLSAMKHWIQHQSLPERITTKTRRQIQRCAHNYLIYNDALYYAEGAQHRRLVIPTEYTAHIIREFHDAPWGGHFSTDKTISRIERFYFWNGMRKQIQKHCAECIPCQLRKTPSNRHSQQLTLWPTTSEPLIRVTVDVFGPIKPSRKGNTIVLVVTDFLTRFVWARPLPNQTAPTIARELINIFLDTGFPQQLVSDCGTNFT